MTEHVYRLKNGQVISAYADEKGNISITKEALEIMIDSWNEGYKKGRNDAIDEFTEKCFDEFSCLLHNKELGLTLSQSLTIYSGIMYRCNEIAEQLKEGADHDS